MKRAGDFPESAPRSGGCGVSPGLGILVEQCLAAKAKTGLRPAYLTGLRQYWAAFALAHCGKTVESITHEDLSTWFSGRGEPPATEASNRGRLSSLFRYAIRIGWLGENPVDRLEPIRLTRVPPSILSPEVAEVLVRRTAADAPRMLAWVALGLFAGLRPSEAAQMTWEGVRDEVIVVDAGVSKVRRRRIVKPPGAALWWLREASERGGGLPVPSIAVRRFLRAARGWIGQSEGWPQDLLRHTCASYWLALAGDAGKVAYMLGNSAGVLLSHYQELVSSTDAARFWAIAPERSSGNFGGMHEHSH